MVARMPGPRPKKNAARAEAIMKKIKRADVPSVLSRSQRMRKAMAVSPKAHPYAGTGCRKIGQRVTEIPGDGKLADEDAMYGQSKAVVLRGCQWTFTPGPICHDSTGRFCLGRAADYLVRGLSRGAMGINTKGGWALCSGSFSSSPSSFDPRFLSARPLNEDENEGRGR
jgi:hypothetical protein